MATNHPITPFPDHIDRGFFASWLSGFADGEGHFGLTVRKSKGGSIRPDCVFKIELRQDDLAVLERIQSFLQCGSIVKFRRELQSVYNAKPTALFCVYRVPDLVEHVISHFDAFPLQSKKASDFPIWKVGVLLAWRIYRRQRRRVPGRPGTQKWTHEELAEFISVSRTLQGQRGFKAQPASVPTLAISPSLFDGLGPREN